MDKEDKAKFNKIKFALATQLGVGVKDIDNEDSFREDLHMNSLDITDFLIELQKLGYSTEELDFDIIETLNDLYENIS